MLAVTVGNWTFMAARLFNRDRVGFGFIEQDSPEQNVEVKSMLQRFADIEVLVYS